jgi:hypothetical protein
MAQIHRALFDEGGGASGSSWSSIKADEEAATLRATFSGNLVVVARQSKS